MQTDIILLFAILALFVTFALAIVYIARLNRAHVRRIAILDEQEISTLDDDALIERYGMLKAILGEIETYNLIDPNPAYSFRIRRIREELDKIAKELDYRYNNDRPDSLITEER